MKQIFLVCQEKDLLKKLAAGLEANINLINQEQIKDLNICEVNKLVNMNEEEIDLFDLIPVRDLLKIDFIQLDSSRFQSDALVEIAKWFLGAKGKNITTFKDDDDKLEVIDFKEDVLRKHFKKFLTQKELEKEIRLIRNDPDYLFDEKMYLAREGGQLKGTGTIKYLNNNEAFLHNGYGKGFGAVATLLALRITEARKRGVKVFKSEVFRDNQLGTNHLKRFSFKKTDKTRLAACSKTKMVDLWQRSF